MKNAIPQIYMPLRWLHLYPQVSLKVHVQAIGQLDLRVQFFQLRGRVVETIRRLPSNLEVK